MNEIRAEFEKWYGSKPKMTHDGRFVSLTANQMWRAWQAAWQIRQGDLKIAMDALQFYENTDQIYNLADGDFEEENLSEFAHIGDGSYMYKPFGYTAQQALSQIQPPEAK